MPPQVAEMDLSRLAEQAGFSLDGDELDSYGVLAAGLTDSLVELEQIPAPERAPVDAIRDAGRRPTSAEDPYNALVRVCSVRARQCEGPLVGVRVALKDAIAIAGVPLTGGSRLLERFVPTRDSVVVERLLAAGATIAATANMDELGCSAGGDTSVHGPTRNPFDPARSAGGSSSGSAACLHYDAIDASLGCDQAGSIRVPAAWCGVLGLKPTYGLVPYTRILGIDASLDHCGPLGRHAIDVARLLAVIAGRDPSDSRHASTMRVQDYVESVEHAPERLEGARIGVVAESLLSVETDVREAFGDVVERFRGLGAVVRSVSLPEHRLAGPIAAGSFLEPMAALLESGGNDYGRGGDFWPELSLALAQGLARSAEGVSPQLKLILTFGTFLRRHYRGYYYARAREARPALAAAYDRAVARYDALLLPTVPCLPFELDLDLSIVERVERGWGVLANATPTNLSGHPALTIPAAEHRGLPVGAMLVGRRFDDAALLRLARVFERAYGRFPEAAA